MTVLRVVIRIVIVIVMGLGFTQAAERTVIPGTPYSMSLPGSPTCEAEAVEMPFDVDLPVSCSVVVDNLEYTFDYIVMPIEVPNDQAEGAMFGAALGRAVAMGGDIADKKVGKVHGYPSMDVSVVVEGRGTIACGRLVVVRSHLVRATVEATDGTMTCKSVDKVLKSLRLE